MASVFRSHLATAAAVGIVVFLVTAALQPATAEHPARADDPAAGRSVAFSDFYVRTKSSADCELMVPGYCKADPLIVRCRKGDRLIGGTGWLIRSNGDAYDLSALDMVDRPHRGRAWQVTAIGDSYPEYWTVYVRAYCARTG